MFEKKIKSHPYVAVKQMRWIFVFGVIPLIRGLIATFKGDFSVWTQGLWLDLSILILITIYAVIYRHFNLCIYNNYSIEEEVGLFFHYKKSIPWQTITLIKLYQPFYLRPFGASYIRVDTIGGNYRKSDINICLPTNDALQLIEFYRKNHDDSNVEMVYHPKLSSIIALASISTNNMIGVIYLATFISQSGKILGNEFSDMLVGSFENFARTISVHVPPAAAAIAYFILIAWLIGVGFTVVRYGDYKVARKEDSIVVDTGIFSKQTQIIPQDQINYFYIPQNVLAYIFGFRSLYVSVVGVGKERMDTKCIIPSLRKSEFDKELEKLLPSYTPSENYLYPRKGMFRYFLEPTIYLVLCLTFVFAGSYFFPHWQDFILFVGTMVFIPIVGLFIIRVAGRKQSGVGYANGVYTLRHSDRFTLQTILIPEDQIVQITLKQSWWQQYRGNATLKIHTVSEGRKIHKAYNVEHKKALEFFSLTNPDIIIA